MTSEERAWISSTAAAAAAAGHVWPEMAACEAALESNYGQSLLAREANNLFGMKQHNAPRYETVTMVTHEFASGEPVTITANFVKYPSLQDCFEDRMETLRRLSSVFDEYAAALAARTAYDYVVSVSKSWSTDPDRAKKVLAIYKEAYQGTAQETAT